MLGTAQVPSVPDVVVNGVEQVKVGSPTAIRLHIIIWVYLPIQFVQRYVKLNLQSIF